jgi:hypothetical protein
VGSFFNAVVPEDIACLMLIGEGVSTFFFIIIFQFPLNKFNVKVKNTEKNSELVIFLNISLKYIYIYIYIYIYTSQLFVFVKSTIKNRQTLLMSTTPNMCNK